MKMLNCVHKTAKTTKLPIIIENTVTVSPRMALRAAQAYVCVRSDEIEFCKIAFSDNMYELILSTAWLRYDIFVSSESGEVLGCNFEPVEY